MKYVIDASFLASLFLPDESSQATDAIARSFSKDGATAPAVLQLEIINILLLAERRRRITGTQFKQILEAWEALPIAIQPLLASKQCSEVVRLAQSHSLSAYDAAYLELSMRLGLPLASLDEALNKAAHAEGVTTAMA